MQRSLDTLMAFEASYGTQLTLERSSRPGGHPLMPQPGGGGGALVALEPPTTHAVASKVGDASQRCIMHCPLCTRHPGPHDGAMLTGTNGSCVGLPLCLELAHTPVAWVHLLI